MLAAQSVDLVIVVTVISTLAAVIGSYAAWKQMQAQRHANAPRVTGSTCNSDGNGVRAEGELELTFETPLHIRKATVKIRPGSGLIKLGMPGESEATRSRVVLRNVAAAAPVSMPALFAPGQPQARLLISMAGRGFGRIHTRLDPTVQGGSFFVY